MQLGFLQVVFELLLALNVLKEGGNLRNAKYIGSFILHTPPGTSHVHWSCIAAACRFSPFCWDGRVDSPKQFRIRVDYRLFCLFDYADCCYSLRSPSNLCLFANSCTNKAILLEGMDRGGLPSFYFCNLWRADVSCAMLRSFFLLI